CCSIVRQRPVVTTSPFNDPSTTEIYPLSLHDALPIYHDDLGRRTVGLVAAQRSTDAERPGRAGRVGLPGNNEFPTRKLAKLHHRSEEHTSELQSRSDLVCRLLLEKKKTSIETTQSPST